ncbi:hypothetical protein E4T56_gene18289 [Termitomyces sp. T112]|nr:hypothetical protein E4T56_gene18289 [Termitomyces sp. T112]
MATPLVSVLRTGVFAFVILASVIILALCAHVTNTTVTLFDGYLVFAALGIASSLLAFLSLPVMLIVDKMRKGAVTSMIVVEIAWSGILWVLFLSTAATASQAAGVSFGHSCPSRSLAILTTTCREFMAIQAFAHMAWLVLFGYFVTLITLSIILANRGYHRVWYQSVKETEFNASPVNLPPMAIPTQQHNSASIPTLQYPTAQGTAGTYPPQGIPAPGWAGTPQSPAHQQT